MVCPQVENLISAQLDGEIQGRERELLELHLADCNDCRTTLEEWTRQDRQLRVAFASRQAEVAALVSRVQHSLAARAVRRCSVLIVDDDEYLLPPLTKLASSSFEVVTATSADTAQQVLQSRSIDILLTDQRMPHRTGVQLLEWAKEHSPRTIRLLMTGYSELEDAVDAINRGHVYYYLLKPWRAEDLLQILHNAADKFLLERKRDRYLEELWQLNRELERRVTERTKELEEANLLLERRAKELERLALIDPLTGLLNRREMDNLAHFELKRHARYANPLAIGYIDVDHFKNINTRYLLTGGDEVLKALARILTSSVRAVDSVGRVGGEEFLVLAPNTTAEGAHVLAERIRTTVGNTPITYSGHEIAITVSVGFAVAEDGISTDYQQMTELAAAALAHAKQAGRNRVEIRTIPPAQAC